MNNFDFIMGFNGITSPVGRIIPDRKFISYFPLQNAKITSKTSVQGNKKIYSFHEKNDVLFSDPNFSEVQ